MVSGISINSPQWVSLLVQQTMAYERGPLDTLQSQRDTLQVRTSIYSDITTKIEDLQGGIESLVGSTYGLTNAFSAKTVSVVNANSDINVANVSLSGSSAVPGVYDLTVTKLAQSHQIGSAQQAQSDVALGLSGTFIIGGAQARNVSTDVGASNPVTGFATADLAEDEVEMGSGDYFVEFRQDAESNWQFRLVDSNGDAIRIADADGGTTNGTENWQNYSDVSGTTFDTGRGMTITFAGADPAEQQLFGDIDLATADYTAQGAGVTVEATDTLNDIRYKINNATFADGNGIKATVIDRRLVLTGGSTGADAQIKLFDSSYSGTDGNGVLAHLGIEVDNNGSLTDLANDQLRVAQNAEFSVNNIAIVRSKNTGLTDVVQGLSFDLKKAGSSTITVEEDQDAVVSNVEDILTKVNDLRNYLSAKTQAVVGKDNEDGNPTYTAAPLGSDWSMRWLGQEVASSLLNEYSGALGNAPRYLVDIGITINDDGDFILSDSSKLTAALNENDAGVQSLFDSVLGNLDDMLDRYVDGSGSIIESTKSGLESELDDVNDRIDSYETRLSSREEALTTQYSSIQSQLISMSYQFQSFQAISGGSYSGYS